MAETAQAWAPDEDELRRVAEGRVAPPLAGRFYIEAQEDEAASKATGKRIFKDVEMIEIRIDSRDIRNRAVEDKDRHDYAAQYLAWKAGQDQEAAEGYPLKQWPPIRKGEAETLYQNGIRTVQQLAAAVDARVQILGPFMALKQKAKDWLDEEKRGAGLNKLREENNALSARLAALESMLRTQTGEIESARQAGGVLATPAQDPRVAALEAKLDALLTRQAVPEVIPVRRGRQPGSKNKPKVPNGEQVPKE
jgi:hypothetical protein